LADQSISGEEWLELYRYLLNELAVRGYDDIRLEIEAAASAPVTEESSPEDQARLSKTVRGEVGRTRIRRRRPDEVFQASIEVLQSRLVELPAVAVSLAKHLAVPPASTEFRRDDEYRYALVDSEPIALDRLVIDTPEVAIITRDLSILGARGRVGKR
jgi:hypothetical protein